VAANLSQARALETIALFDPEGAEQHLAAFGQYNELVEQKLCGPPGCTANSFLEITNQASQNSQIAQQVSDAALDEQDRLGLPRTPLVGNVNFTGQAAAYEELRTAYLAWMTTHEQLESQVTSGDTAGATATSTGQSAASFAQVVQKVEVANQVARSEFERIWQRVYTVTGLNQGLALLFPLGGLLAAWGLWQRRNELFA
jgi:hypothetical protein